MPFSHSTFWIWKDKEFRFDVYDETDFSTLTNVTQVYAIVVNDVGKVVITHSKAGIWTLPGGSVEPGETWNETLIREVKEETNCTVQTATITPAFYQMQLYKKDQGVWVEKGKQLRYVVSVENQIPFASDPDNGDITEIKWVLPNELESYLHWEKATDIIIYSVEQFLN